MGIPPFGIQSSPPPLKSHSFAFLVIGKRGENHPQSPTSYVLGVLLLIL